MGEIFAALGFFGAGFATCFVWLALRGGVININVLINQIKRPRDD